jgi:hypothetical protein
MIWRKGRPDGHGSNDAEENGNDAMVSEVVWAFWFFSWFVAANVL